MESRIITFRDALVALDRAKAEEIFQLQLSSTTSVQAVDALVVPALQQIGESWHRGELALAQVYMSGRFCEQMVDAVLPPSDPDRKHQPRSAIAVLCDNHDLGKRIVYAALRAAGFEVFDYGRMEVDALYERVLRDRIEILFLSALMLPSALRVAELTRKLRAATSGLKIVVGGAPFLFDPWLWQEVGADAMGHSAAEALTICERFMQEIRGGAYVHTA